MNPVRITKIAIIADNCDFFVYQFSFHYFCITIVQIVIYTIAFTILKAYGILFQMAGTVSILVAVYNTEKYLRECLDSLINQTYTDLQIICIDDASTDGSLAILKEYEQKDSRILVL